MNQNTLTQLALANNRKNKTRSILIMAAVFLSAMLLSTIAFFGYGAIQNQRINADSLYGNYYGSYLGVDEGQIGDMELRGEFTDIGRMSMVGSVENEKSLNMAWVDDTAKALTNLADRMEQGAWPKMGNEIAAQPGFFESIGYPDVQVGDVITLSYRKGLQDKFKEETFVVSGLIQEPSSDMTVSSYMAYISKGFFEAATPEEERAYTVYFRLNEAVSITSDNAEKVLKDLAKECGIDERAVSENAYYLTWALDPGMETISGCAAIILLVIVFSVVVIYNIFQVGITQKVQEYGKIKAMGATRKQMKQIIFREGMSLAGCAVPFGLTAGFAIAKGMYLWGIQTSQMINGGEELKSVSMFHFGILLLCAFLAFATVWLALKKPMKIVSSISPVEAMRYQSQAGNKKGVRKGRRSMSVRGMTTANLSASRKRTIGTIINMGLSCVLFVILASVVSNMNPEYDARKQVPYGQFAVSLDYSKDDTAYPENNLDFILKKNPLSPAMTEKIESLDGVTGVRTRKLLYWRTDRGLESVAVLDRESFDSEKEQGGAVGFLDYDAASDANAVLHGWSHFLEDEGHSLNQMLQLKLEDGSGTASVSAKLQGAFGGIDGDWAITEDTRKKLGIGQETNGTVWIDCQEKDRKLVQEQLSQLLEGTEHVEMVRYEDALNTSELSVKAMKLLTYAFLAIVGIIGFMNMANTIIVSIITRKRELGVLQAVGMTNNQLNIMLQMEGLFFSLGTILVALAAGIPCGYGAFLYAKEHALFAVSKYSFPGLEIGIMVAAIALLQLILSFLLSRNVKKESLVERIRYQE